MSAIVLAQYAGSDVHFTTDGWFNATAAAAKFGKRPHEWRRLPETRAYIRALERKYGKFTYLRARRGVNGATWLHPKLAVRFAQWLDIDFAVWCDEQIDELLRNPAKQAADALKSLWAQALENERCDERSKALASIGGRHMRDRRDWKPVYAAKRAQLDLLIQPEFEALSGVAADHSAS